MAYPQAHSGEARYDFRSDTVTRPGPAMRAAMAAAEVGDDVWGDDPTVNTLQAEVAALLGFEAALFVPSGTQSNLIALLCHCQRGDEYLVGQEAHTYKYEAGGAAVLGSIQPQPIEHAADGTLPLAKLAAAIKPNDAHFARTRLLALENTIGGQILPASYVADALALARQHGQATHLDGARLWNAAIASNLAPAQIAAGFDSVSVCLSKGLGAPVGSLLCGSDELIASARRWRKMLGGGMRQAGLLAAAGRYALQHQYTRLADDHRRARELADGLSRHAALSVVAPQTNIVFVQVAAEHATGLASHLAGQGILISGSQLQRWVLHLDLDDQAIAAALAAVDHYFESHA